MATDEAQRGNFGDPQQWTDLMDAARPGDEVEEAQARAGVKAKLFGAPAPRVLLSRYLLLERIGSGALGVVYAAYDPELDRKVAIKLLRSVARGAGSERVLQEARALARVAHPNVIAVHDVGTHEQAGDGPSGVFIVMELVDGSDLQRWLGARRRSQAEILDAFIAAARGLQAAHEAGLVHRDFKPGNVLVGGDGRLRGAHADVRVVDFGLARPGQDSTGGTRSESVVGTPAYMAPEQHAGQSVDARADQYAFCVSLYEALHAERPFGGRTTGELLEAKRAGRIPTPARRSRVPRAIQRALERGLQPRPEDRWPTMRDLIAALERARRRRRWLWLAGGVWLGGTAAALALLSSAETPCEDAPRLREEVWNAQTREALGQRFAEADAPYAQRSWATVETEVDAYLDRWVEERTSTCMTTMVERTRPVAEMNRHMRCLDRGLEAVEALVGVLGEAGEAPIERSVELVERLPPLHACAQTDTDHDAAAAEVHRALAMAKALSVAGLPERAVQESERAVVLAEAHASKTLLAEARLIAGLLAIRNGDFDGRAFYAAYAAAEEAGADGLAVEALLRLAGIAIENSRFDEARGLLAMAAGKASRAQLTPGQSVLHRAMLAQLDLASGSRDAIGSARAFVEEARRVYGDDDTEFARAVAAEALALEIAGDIEGYAKRLATAHATIERRFGPDHPSTADALSNYAIALSRVGRHEESIEAFGRARRVLVAAYGEEDNRVARIDGNIGGPLVELGRVDDAIAATERALGAFRRLYGDAHPTVGLAAINVAELQLTAGRPAAAIAPAEQAVAVLEAAQGRDHRHAILAKATQARAQALLGDLDGARPILEDAHRRLAAALGPDHPDVAGVADVLADLYPR
jgi:tetratricopeptide (TPR) repeat protein